MEQWVIFILGLLIFWSVVIMAKRFMPKSFEIHPFLVMWRTTKFNNFIDRMGRRFARLWKVLWTFGTAICIGGSIYITYVLARNLFFILFNTNSASPVTLLLPGITLSLDLNTLFFFGLSLAVIIIFHELSHGVAASAEGIKGKSTGLMLLAVIPGAFYEPEEADLNKARKIAQSRVYAAGSTANIIIGLITIILLVNVTVIMSPFYETTPSGAQITEVVSASPAAGVLRAWDVIKAINGSAIGDPVSLALILNATTPNSTVPMVILRGSVESTINFTLGQSPTRNISYVGVNSFAYYAPRFPWASALVPFYLVGSLSWIQLLSLNIGLINMLPITALDGGKLAEILIGFLIKDEKRAKSASKGLGFACLAILILNITLSFMLFPGFRLG